MGWGERLSNHKTLWAALAGAIALSSASAAPDARQTLTVQGTARTYVLRLPTTPPPPAGHKVPLVLVLHGGGGDALNAEALTGFTDKARREGFIVAYPDGSGRFDRRLLTWNAGHCCGHAMERRVDDVAFIRALIDKLLAEHPVDPRRVYATGISNGAMMSHRLGIELPDRLAAIAPVAGAGFGDEKPPGQPVAALMINGGLDASVPAAGGPPGGRFTEAWDGTPTQPAAAQATFWAKANGCTGPAETSGQGVVARTRYRCPGGRDVELVLIADHPHAWPGGQRGSRLAAMPSAAVNATDEIWAFFQAHPKP
jgi:polyhydroxybutyrate depolymerase